MDQSFSASNAPSRKRQVRWTEEMDIFFARGMDIGQIRAEGYAVKAGELARE